MKEISYKNGELILDGTTIRQNSKDIIFLGKGTMKKLSFIIVFLVFVFLSVGFVSVAFGETYYVRKGGNNNNTGTEPSKNQAWKTISYAVSKLKAGDTCYVMDEDGGTYGENINLNGANNGTSGNEITLAVYPGDSVTVTTNEAWGYGINVWLVQYWIIDGFTINGRESCSNCYAIFIYGADHNTIQNITVTGSGYAHIGKVCAKKNVKDPATHNTLKNIDASAITMSHEAFYIGIGPDDCTGTPWAKTGSPDVHNTFINIKCCSGMTEGFDIKPGSDYTLIQDCTISGQTQCGVITAALDTTVENNVINGSSASGNWGGIWVAKDAIVQNNIIYDYNRTGNQSGIATVNQYYQTVSGNKICNNTIYDCKYGIKLEDGSSTVKNNAVHTASNYLIHVDSSSTGSTIDYNSYYPSTETKFYWNNTAYNFTNWKTASSQDAHSICSDPKFTDATNKDFHLQSDSPCIDAGVNVGLAYYGSAPDMGALEYYGSTIAPPTGLKVITTK